MVGRPDRTRTRRFGRACRAAAVGRTGSQQPSAIAECARIGYACRRAPGRREVDAGLQPHGWYDSLSGAELSTDFDGAEANVNGFVYHDPDLGEDEFWLVRFTVSCCVADPSAMSLLVHWPDAETLEDNQWVQVAGQIDAAQLDNRNLPSLDAVKVELIPSPNQPYLYP